MSLKLHLGCGTKHIPGFVNIDIRYLPKVDEVNNIKFLRNYKVNSADLIYACHVLEHFSRWDYKNVLRRWYVILKPEGILRSIMGLLYGGQDYDENYHYVTYDFKMLSDTLTELGFKNIKQYNWKETEHADIDDYSKAYLPHMNRDGLLMSLNIEAQK